MRWTISLLAIASLSACGTQSGEGSNEQQEVKPAALTFDGADYQDDAAKIAHGADVEQDLFGRQKAPGLEAIAEGFRLWALKMITRS